MSAAGTDINKAAPLFIGCIISWFLSGSLMVQTYDYFCDDHLEGDMIGIKLAVGLAFILDMARSMSVTSAGWERLVSGWGDPTSFSRISIFAAMTVPLTGLESCVVQTFFAWRIWNLRRGSKVGRFVPCIISSVRGLHGFLFFVLRVCVQVALVQFAAAVVHGICCYQSDNFNIGKEWLKLSTEIWLSGSFLCDCIIVMTMIILLVQAKLESSFVLTRRLIDRLIIVTLETGAITVVVILVQLGIYIKYPEDALQHVAVMYILGGLYANVLLAVLNGRKRARRLVALTHHSLSLHFAEHIPSRFSSATLQEALMSDTIMRSSQVSV
ncbi:uncharacterized protein LACBIDRAFT_315353 [Laccaria bicolor S238N-H82]|uniref:Predicted protein n=1 Tax=Laccaria bicolor (strain S238N-H82 / ATCC MYA-4686) TaxID=486041 RepID=B0D272_LACBS|nr:uncharacterized protein LACBIDRAFT_315353 [Laccaria bicolor S238N-H82]EDR11054.1 predicted protein [Laccaria bicolor S238N-H82]|eukprot:XP_001878355.1 predicted protein [Laccaria bicolor S238N-H82]